MRIANKLRFMVVVLLMALPMLPACSLYRADLSQGNHITQEDLDKLHPNQTKHEVQEIMGTPATIPYFNLDQWNYTYAFVDGTHRDQALKFKTISLYFKGGKLQNYSSKYWHPTNLPKASK